MTATQVFAGLGGLGLIGLLAGWWVVTKAVKVAVRIGVLLVICAAGLAALAGGAAQHPISPQAPSHPVSQPGTVPQR